MARRTLHMVGAVGLMAGVAIAAGPSALASTPHHGTASLPGIGRLIPSVTHELLPVHGGTATSLNWSGYAVQSASPSSPTPSNPGDITGVTTQFTVPSAALLPPGFAATWAGIGGYNTSDLIQAGVGENSLITNPITGPQYYAWYELLPNSETPISGCQGDSSCTVTPGDNVTVNIQQVSGDTWSVSLVDAGHWTWQQNVTYSSSRSSAEWILEAPTVGLQTLLADVGTVHFSSDTFNVNGGPAQSIGSGNPTEIVLSPGLINEATPSALGSGGQSFNDCAYAQTCPAP